MITKDELVEVLHYFLDPFYILIGAGLALCVLVFAYLLLVYPFIRRI